MQPSGSDKPHRFQASGFFVLRTPLLPVDELLGWSRDLAAHSAADGPDLDAALGADRTALLSRLLGRLKVAEIREAIFVASPTLAKRLALWMEEGDRFSDSDAQLSLLRYFIRMTSRPTPFGLFAGYSVGTTGAPTRLELPERSGYRRRSRLDTEYLASLAVELEQSPGAREQLIFRANSSIYECAGQIRYAECRRDKRKRSYHLVAVERNDALVQTIERARSGGTLDELAQALVAPGVELRDARDFVSALIECGILVSDLDPAVTGPDAIEEIASTCRRVPALRGAAEAIDAVQADLRALDSGPIGTGEGGYASLSARLAQFSAEADIKHLFQVDLSKPAMACNLGGDAISELARAIDVLHRLAPPRYGPLERFREAFARRYEEREVPLTDALDEESGIGFGDSETPLADPSPLLAGLAFAEAAGTGSRAETSQEGYLLQLLERCWRDRAVTIDLTEKDIDALATPDRPSLPDAVAVMATLIGDADRSPQPAKPRILVNSVTGPSGIRLFGRFCQADPELDRHVRAHISAEEALRPNAVFAEVVCQPQDRLGNVLARPVLREFEIPYLGRSGAPLARQIPITDLLVSVAGDRIILRSRTLQREILPRLSTAHLHSHAANPGIYRFLAALQTQSVAGGMGWNWGAFEKANFLPRVTSGRVILSRARWLVSTEESKELKRLKGAALFRAVQDIRAARRLPRWIVLVKDDNELTLDLDNVLCIDALQDMLQPGTVLTEWIGDACCVRGPEGSFTHEVVVPFVRRPDTANAADIAPAPLHMRSAQETDSAVRTFFPGSEWLYVKLYGGAAAADGLLNGLVVPLVEEALRDGAAHGWFFLRYSDPEPHLRLRLRGDAQRLWTEVLPAIRMQAEPFVSDGLLRKIELGTYERELERYGGVHGIGPSEAIFQADSEAASAFVRHYPGGSGQDFRWRLALLSIDRLLGDFGIAIGDRAKLLGQIRDHFAVEMQASRPLRQSMRERLRSERGSLFDLLGQGGAKPAEFVPGLDALDRRSETIVPIASALRALDREGHLSVAELLPSYIHMSVNRIMRTSQREHEFVLCDFLSELYRSMLAMRQAAGTEGGSG